MTNDVGVEIARLLIQGVIRMQQNERNKRMDTIKLLVGSVVSGSGGQVNDTRREVEFTGEQLAHYNAYGCKESGAVDDTRGCKQALFKTDDDRLIVHVSDWSHWQGEPSVETLHEVTPDDLGPTGKFAQLGWEAGYGRPLTLDEALEQRRELHETTDDDDD